MCFIEELYKKSFYVGEDRALRVLKRRANGVSLHAHEYFELEIILEGNGKQRLNGVESVLQPGSIYLLTPSDFHEILPGCDLLLWNISFTEAIIPADRLHFLCNNAIFQQLNTEQLRKLDLVTGLLQEEYTLDGCVRLLFEFLLTLILRYDRIEEPPTPIQKAVFYIDTHFREHLSLSQVAQQACLSPVYFGSLFKQHTGMTYSQYLNTHRVACAKMLLESGYTVAEACYEAGFGSLSNFLHTFKQEVGISPKEYKYKCKQI